MNLGQEAPGIYIYIYIVKYYELKLIEAVREINSKSILNHVQILINHSH
jgi:hypothetical protein